MTKGVSVQVGHFMVIPLNLDKRNMRFNCSVMSSPSFTVRPERQLKDGQGAVTAAGAGDGCGQVENSQSSFIKSLRHHKHPTPIQKADNF
jgi:hypothetical protein